MLARRAAGVGEEALERVHPRVDDHLVGAVERDPRLGEPEAVADDELGAAEPVAARAGPRRPRSGRAACARCGRPLSAPAVPRPGRRPRRGREAARRRRSPPGRPRTTGLRRARGGRHGGEAASAGRAGAPTPTPRPARARAPRRPGTWRRSRIPTLRCRDRGPARAPVGRAGSYGDPGPLDRLADGVGRVDARGAGLGGQDDAMREDVRRDVLHVGGHARSRGLARPRAPWRRGAARCPARGLAPERKPRIGARVVQDVDDVAVQRVLDEHPPARPRWPPRSRSPSTPARGPRAARSRRARRASSTRPRASG